MNMDEMLKNLNPQSLQKAMSQLGGILSPEQMQQVQKTLSGANKQALGKNLNSLNFDDFKQELQKNPNLARQLANNPEIMQKINQIFGQK